jgi:hypothetical protein
MGKQKSLFEMLASAFKPPKKMPRDRKDKKNKPSKADKREYHFRRENYYDNIDDR